MKPVESGQAYWDRHAKNYARSMALLGKPMPRALALSEQAVNGAENALEVAAGTGLFSVAIARRVTRLVATDYAPAMLRILEQRAREHGLTNVKCVPADIHALPFASESFDAVVAANVLHLLPDLPKALAELARVLKPNGVLVAPTFCHDETRLSWLVSRVLAVTGFPSRRRFTAASLRAALAGAGFAVRRQETVPGLIPIVYAEATITGA
jgi:ubiquinone/menaquinone biosynthesis C-methylase UbiE